MKTEILPGQVGTDDSMDISDREHYVYAAVDEAARKALARKREADARSPMTVFSGIDAWDLIIPNDRGVVDRILAGKRNLWAVIASKPFVVNHNGAPVAGSDFELSTLALSPDGQSLVTKLRIKEVPPSWERLYPPPYQSAPFNTLHGGGSANQYVRIDLKNGTVRSLTDAPTGRDAGWFAGSEASPNWSSDGQSVILPETFIKSSDDAPSRPCIAVVDIAANKRTCVEELKSRTADGSLAADYHHIVNAHFIRGDRDQIEIDFSDRDESGGTIEYRRTPDSAWQVLKKGKDLYQAGHSGLQITVKQQWDHAPLLAASIGQASRVIWDPNPQFKNLDLGEVRLYKWKDKESRNWTGGLYLPAGYHEGQRYPLVIQTHGFSESLFGPSGAFPTAFAARELAAAGIAVLQVGGARNCPAQTVDEAPCQVSGFESAVRRLAAEGLIDSDKVGYIGFSHSCYYGMQMLTKSSIRLRAALLADGFMADYLQFMFGADGSSEIGATPFGDGLQSWIKNSPGFNLEKVTAPLLIATESERKMSGITMWQPFAGLRYLKKPVELVMINTDEHVITNPVERLASQGLSVDWFRFWLQGYDDPDPAKADEYKRWHELRKLEEAERTASQPN